MMKYVLTLSILTFFAVSAQAGKDVIYGKDNRQDFYEVTSSLHRKLALSTAGMVDVRHFKKSSRENFFDLEYTDTLETSMNVCPSEAFSQQHLAPNCSGFLVSPDTLVTAGHCYKSGQKPEEACKGSAWLFGYEMKSPSHDPTRDIPKDNVYLCKKVMAVELNGTMDYAVIKLDRPVVGREPLKFRNAGKIADSTSLVVIGHPTGLPTKISPAGKVTKNTQATTFSTTLDTFAGNSGSAVFDAQTGVIEGILIQGKNDYMPSKKNDAKSCQVVNSCDDNGNNCAAGEEYGSVQWGEVVFRIETVAKKIHQAINTRVN